MNKCSNLTFTPTKFNLKFTDKTFEARTSIWSQSRWASGISLPEIFLSFSPSHTPRQSNHICRSRVNYAYATSLTIMASKFLGALAAMLLVKNKCLRVVSSM